jgi:protein-tyrosine phosphatase
MKILFVCTGNICRSPLAEALARHEAEKRGLTPSLIEIASAGIHGYHTGEPPDPRSVDVAYRWGVSMRGQKARKIALRDFEHFDLILAMDQGHLEELIKMAPAQATAKLGLFMTVAMGSDEDIPDPYYGGMEDFLYVRDRVSVGINKLFEKINKI